MATNITFNRGNHQSLPVPAGTKSGDPVRVGIINGVCVTDRANTSVNPFNADGSVNSTYNYGGGNPDGYASVWTWGGHRIKVKAGAKPAFGDAVYFDPAGTPCKPTVTAGSLSVFGAVADDNATDNGDGSWSCIVDVASPVK